MEILALRIHDRDALQLNGFLPGITFTAYSGDVIKAAERLGSVSLDSLQIYIKKKISPLKSCVPLEDLKPLEAMLVATACALETRYAMTSEDLAGGNQCPSTSSPRGGWHCTLTRNHPGVEHIAHEGVGGKVIDRWVDRE